MFNFWIGAISGVLFGIVLGGNLFLWLSGKLVLELSELIIAQNDLMLQIGRFLMEPENAE